MFDYLAPFYDRFMNIVGRGMIEETFGVLDLNNGEKVLDVGGGTGRLGEMIQERVKGVEVYILDINSSMLKQADIKGLNHSIKGDSGSMPFKNNSFDFVVCTDSLHHFKNKGIALEEMLRVLESKGKLVISDLIPGSYVTKFITYSERFLGEPTVFYPKNVLRNFFYERGYEATIKDINSFQYIMIVRNRS